MANSTRRYHSAKKSDRFQRNPVIGVLAGWQFYNISTNLNYLLPIYQGINQAAEELDCSVLFGCGMGADSGLENPNHPAWPQFAPDCDFAPIGERNTNGLIVFTPLHSSGRSDYIRRLREKGHPVLFIGSGEEGATIAADNVGGVKSAFDHLVRHGHRRIAFIAGSRDDLAGDTGERLAAYRETVQNYGFDSDDRLVAYGGHVYRGGYKAMKRILSSQAEFTAVIASNDEMAIGAIQALKETGLETPRDVAVIGFDNRLEGAANVPPLTTVEIPLFDMGRRALEEMIRYLGSGEPLSPIIRVPTRLVIRESCGCDEFAEARSAIQDHMHDNGADSPQETTAAMTRRQFYRFVSAARTDSNRLSLLSAALFSALTEDQIYSVLSTHLKLIGISDALIVRHEAGDGIEPARSSVIDVFHPDRKAIHFDTRIFPPSRLIPDVRSFRWVVIPFPGNAGLSGAVVFDSGRLDLYGAVVQQISGALKMAGLYKEATDGRRLAEEAHQMKNRFLSLVGHELRTPLNLIAGLSELLLKSDPVRRDPIADPVMKDLEHIHAYAQHLGGLIGDVLDLATSDAGELRLNLTSVDLARTLRMIADSGAKLAAGKGLKWRAELPFEGPRVWGDPMRLRQIVLNLINNAIKFTECGEIRLRVEERGTEVTISVSDTGSGIPIADQQVIFEEFRRSDSSVSLGYGGLGLGLAICKRLVDLHGGQIGVRSKGVPGMGSTFYFTLPTISDRDADETRIYELTDPVRSIALLTDRASDGDPLVDQLVRRGYRVTVSPPFSGGSDRPNFPDPFPDVVLIDTEPKSGSFWDVLKAIKENPLGRNTSVLFYRYSNDAGRFVELDYMTKPIEIERLTDTLQKRLPADGEPRGQRTILIADDDPNTLDLYARVLQKQSKNNRVLRVLNGRDALTVLETEPEIDLLLLDLQMPELDGFQVLQWMQRQERTRNIPVIVVTGKVLTHEDMEKLNHGVSTILEKGLFSLDETIARISAALDRTSRLSEDSQRMVRRAMAFMHERYQESLTRRDIARYVSISEDYLTFCFRKELGTTPIKYLHRYRVHQAQRLLRDTERTVLDIGLEVGFYDGGYFSRIFRQIVGVSPETYRRNRK